MSIRDHVVLLVGGVGGAKLALGLSNILPPENLTIIVNTGDDFVHLGLHVSPDLDTVMYTLAGMANQQFGWGIEGDTKRAIELIERYHGPAWFKLGDTDLGTNILRTHLLAEGYSLSEITQRFRQALGIRHRILPMSDDPVRTILDTEQGTMAFQEYFVRERWQPVVNGIRFDGAETAQASPVGLAALQTASLIILGPSNPFLSIDPILSIVSIRKTLEKRGVPCIALTPIIGGKAVKGPSAKLMAELGIDVSPVGVATHYRKILCGMIIDGVDAALAPQIESQGIRCAVHNTLMNTKDEKVQVAEYLLAWSEEAFL